MINMSAAYESIIFSLTRLILDFSECVTSALIIYKLILVNMQY